MKAIWDRREEIAPYLVLVAAVFAAYANVYKNDFLFDDFHLIVNNQFLKSWSHLPDLLTLPNMAGGGRTDGFYRPVPALIHLFAYQGFGASVVAFHALNVLLHAANTCLVYLLGRRLNLKAGAALAGALLWGLHPLHTEAVTFMAAMPELLWSFFCLLGLVVMLPDFTVRRIWAAMLFFLLALGCKQAAMVFPAMATLSLFLVHQERHRLSTYIRLWPLWLMTGVYIAVLTAHLNAVNFDMRDPWDSTDMTAYMDSMLVRLFTSLATLPVYFKLIVWPHGLHMERDFPVFETLRNAQVLAGVAIVTAGLLPVLWGGTRRGLALTFGVLWFAVALSPNTGVLKPINALISEHWLYFPTIGLFLGVAATAAHLLRDKKAFAAGLVLLAALPLAVKTHFQNRVWESSISFNENILANGGRPARAHNNLIEAYMAAGEFDKSLEHYRIAQDLPRDNDTNRIAALHTFVALAHLHVRTDGTGSIQLPAVIEALPQSKHIPEAIEELERAVAVNPAYVWAPIFLSLIYDYLGDKEKAVLYNRKAEEILKQGQP